MSFESKVVVPAGEKIQLDAGGKLQVPNNPIIPFIRGDGIGADITPVMHEVVNTAVEKAYAGSKKILGWKSTQVALHAKFMARMCTCQVDHGVYQRLPCCHQAL